MLTVTVVRSYKSIFEASFILQLANSMMTKTCIFDFKLSAYKVEAHIMIHIFRCRALLYVVTYPYNQHNRSGSLLSKVEPLFVVGMMYKNLI